MADNIFEELKAYEAPKRLPKIAEHAIALYEQSGFKLTDADIQALAAELRAQSSDLKSLTDAIVGISVFALWVRDQRKDNESAERVVRIIGEHASKYAFIGERIVSALQDLAGKATELFEAFSGREEKKRAPMHGDPGLPGSVPAKSILPVAEPPPHLKKAAAKGPKKKR